MDLHSYRLTEELRCEIRYMLARLNELKALDVDTGSLELQLRDIDAQILDLSQKLEPLAYGDF